MDLIVQLRNELVEKMPFQKNGIIVCFDKMGDDLKRFLAKYILLCQRNNISLAEIADAYAFLLKETMKEQIYFSKYKKYRYKYLSDVLEKVYANAEYMRKYMIGLAISTAIWDNHVKIYQFFRKTMETYNCTRGGYLEVGAGHGLFCAEAIKKGNNDWYDIVDISASSLQLTKNIVQDVHINKNVNYIHADFLKFNGKKYGFISMGEVLEHVENPERFLEKCHKLIDEGGHVYISTCLNAPEPDHIYLFRNLAELENMIKLSDFKIEDSIVLPYQKKTKEECEEEMLPVNVALVLTPC